MTVLACKGSKNYILGLLLATAMLCMGGCSISHSISSSSDSSASISRSSSGPSVSEEERKAYVQDVATYVDAIGNSGVSAEDFMRGISRIAKKHGITDWEGYKYTYIGIGKGLKAAGIAKDQVSSLACLKVLLSGNSERLKYIEQGY